MFSIFSSQQKKTRQHAENWLRLAEKVYHYRKDVLKEREVQELLGASTQLQEALRRNDDASKIRMASDQLEDVLRRYGGPYYRKAGWTDNVEVLLVAAILAIGIRTYFVQPFKIPTNSMWPTYHGMTHEVFTPEEKAPGGVGRVFRKMAYGASRHYVEAPVSGEIRVAVARDHPRLAGNPAQGRRYLIFPMPLVEYYLYVDQTPVGIQVPLEFQIEPVFRDLFFPEASSLEAALSEQARAGKVIAPEGSNVMIIGTGIHVEAGDPLVNFDILTGDQLFVDRMSYHFVRPSVGDGIVFRTGTIGGLRGQSGEPENKYYIKRLVGTPGDELQIEEGVLLRDGEPITGAKSFAKNAKREGKYVGYVASGMLAPGRTVSVPEDKFYAMGDNSPNSLDSRAWGFVPEAEVVGRSLFIYYPFTKRWGPAQ